MRKCKFLKTGISLFVALVTLCSSQIVMAGNSDIEQRNGSLTVQCSVKNADKSVSISGVQVEIYKVADIDGSGSDVSYKITSDFQGAGASLANVSAVESSELAKKFTAFQESKNLSGAKAVTGADGKAFYGDLNQGLYLVKQTGSDGTAKKYASFDPFLISVPTLIDGSWTYDVTVKPKPMEKEPTNPAEDPIKDDKPKDPEKKPAKKPAPGTAGSGQSSNVKTGDTTDIMSWVFILLAALAGIVIISIRSYNRKQRPM